MKLRRTLLGALSLAVLAAAAGVADAHVLRVEVESKMLMKGDFGQPYEMWSGHFYGEIDPKDPHNTIITDLEFAPRNAKGMVEYSATFSLSKPVDMTKASGVLFYDTSNRGNGTPRGDRDGHVHLISGWQGDIVPGPDRQTARFPIARNADGSPISGPVFVRIVDPPAGPKSVKLTGGLGGGVPRPEPLTLNSAKANLWRKVSDTDKGKYVPAGSWAFSDCTDTPFPGKPDPHSLCLKDGFDPKYAYELTYTGKDPVVLGMGFAATRDLVSFMRSSSAADNPLAGKVKWTIGAGVSQAGNFIRSFVHLGFNADEASHIVFDGVNPQIAARQVPLNVRFAVPGGAANLYEPGSEGALWWSVHDDTARGFGKHSLLDRCNKTKTCPKVMETFGAAEFWGLRMSPDLVGGEAKVDIPLPDNVRRYYFPSVTHGGGRGGFDLLTMSSGGVSGCSLPANPNPVSDSLRALTKSFVDWVTTGKEPPASRYPTLAKGDLVPPTAKALKFPVIPGTPSPYNKLNTFAVYDFGAAFNSLDVSGEMRQVPPAISGIMPSVVPRVDADGNETSGVPSVQLRVPLGTYVGWNEVSGGFYKGGECGFQGGFIPFATTKAEREAAKDPRPSLEERYGTHDAFVAKVKAAADAMVGEGMLLREDADRIVKQAQDSKVLVK